ncbi:MAG TPA: thioredoxin domain-containing protein [Candidatus Binatia bacterium]
MEHRHTNHLIHETSPYLLQHAHNPVDWYPWGDEAFQKAKNENRPILLSIGYSACHWCHVMERESFEDERIAALMNDLFVNIKVDREERPDLDEIYMNAVQMLTGRGGWPMTVFLTPEGKPFYGGTYFPPEDRYGVPGFPKILQGVANAYREKPQDVERSVEQILAALQRMSLSTESQQPFSSDIIGQSAEQLAQAYDTDHGGLGKAPKFPNVGVYELFLRHYHHSKGSRFLEMVTHTLTKMARGGIYDHLGGGFHRYSVDEKWLVPHFEKMLYDNAQLVRIYAQVYCVTGEPLFKQVVDETINYLMREMLHTGGGFYSTQDADSEGEEGKFFVWTEEEISQILGEEASEIFCRIYDVSEEGNFEEKNILHPILTLEQASKFFRRDLKEIESLVSDAKRKLFQEREKRPKPFRDEKILTSWNGLMLSGFAEAIKISPHPSYLEATNRTVDFIFTKMFRDGHLLHTYKSGTAKILGYLDDYAFLAAGLLDLFEATVNRAHLDRALELAEIMLHEFWDEAGGGFFYTGRSHERLIAQSKPIFDGSIPSGNAVATQVLLRLYHYTGKEDYLKRAERILRAYYNAMENQPFGFAHMLAALDFYLQKPKEVVLVGDKKEPKTLELLTKIHSLYVPNMTLQLASPDDSLEKVSPLLAGKKQFEGKTTVYVCHNFTCSRPVVEWDELKPLLDA